MHQSFSNESLEEYKPPVQQKECESLSALEKMARQMTIDEGKRICHPLIHILGKSDFINNK